MTQGVIKAFNVASEARVFAHSLVLRLRNNGLIGFPEVGVADALFVAFGYGVPEQLAGSFTPTTDDARDNLPGVFAQS